MPAVDKDWGDMHDQQFLSDDPRIWSNKSHRGCFYQQNFKRPVFPPTAVNVELYGNYDNCVLPPGYTLIEGTNRRINVQKDLDDWVLTSNDNPIEPVDKKGRLRRGESIDPVDIPAIAIRTEKMTMKRFDIEFAGVKPIKESWFKETPTIKSTNVIPISTSMGKTAHEAREDDGPFDSTPTRNTKKEQGKRILIFKHRNNRNLDIYEPVIILEGFQTKYEVEGEVWLFKDKEGVFHDVATGQGPR